MFLGAAALLKAEAIISGSQSHSQLFQWLAVVVELVVAIWLCSGIQPRLAQRTALSLFALFSFISLYFAFSGARSCGCFGRLAVNPWITFGIDVTACAVLWVVDHANKLRASIVLRTAGAAAVLLLVAAGLFQLMLHPASIEAADSSTSLIILDPEKWIGRQWPLETFVDFDLRPGAWTIVLYHHDCNECLKRMPEFERRARGGERMLLIEMPPFARTNRDPVPKDTACMRARLSNQKEWFAQTPAVVYLVDGIVVQK